MKVLVITSDVPFIHGGHRIIASCLVRALQARGVQAEALFTPQNRFGRQFAAYLATYLTDVGLTGTNEKVDQIVTLRFPSYALRHDRHVCWLLHRMREYYDLWPEWRARLSWKGAVKERVRRALIQRADSYFLRRVTKLFALSATVQQRLRRWGGIDSEVLHPPPPQRPYRCDSFGDFIFAPSRLNPLKRQQLLVEAMAAARDRSIRAVISGGGESHEMLAALIRDRGLEARCTLAGHLSEDALIEHYAQCRAVFFAPKSEDYGFVTAEAFASGKPVVTCVDSGGAAELVEDGGNGFVVAPEPAAVAARIDELAGDRELAERLGDRGRTRVSAVTWEKTADRLLLQE
ncbi:MAG: glycosyltransferase family 4 protein [Acidobacteriota bacterium]